MRRISFNKLGPEAGIALAEALKSNTTLEWLGSAALSSNPPTHALWLHPPTNPQQTPARRRLDCNGLGDDAEQALRAAARSGLKLILNDDDFLQAVS